jgi:hypothetical protein
LASFGFVEAEGVGTGPRACLRRGAEPGGSSWAEVGAGALAGVGVGRAPASKRGRGDRGDRLTQLVPACCTHPLGGVGLKLAPTLHVSQPASTVQLKRAFNPTAFATSKPESSHPFSRSSALPSPRFFSRVRSVRSSSSLAVFFRRLRWVSVFRQCARRLGVVVVGRVSWVEAVVESRVESRWIETSAKLSEAVGIFLRTLAPSSKSKRQNANRVNGSRRSLSTSWR